MTKYKTILSSILALAAVLVVPVAAAAEAATAPMQARCAACHKLDEPSSLTGKEWERRLDAMRRFDTLAGAEREELLGFMREHTRKAEAMVAMAKEERLFEEKCGFCHASARIFMVPTSEEDRRHIVLRMREHWEGGESWIKPEEAERILAYVEQAIASGSKPPRKEIAGGAKEAFRTRCVGCHSMDRIYEKIALNGGNTQTWMHIVERMRAKETDWISEEEARQIVEYIVTRRSGGK